jgi:hypothetical protein
MTQAFPGNTRPRSMRLIARLIEKHGLESAEVRTAWKFFRAGYDAALDDFLDATTPSQQNDNWYNDEPTLKAVRRKLRIGRARR